MITSTMGHSSNFRSDIWTIRKVVICNQTGTNIATIFKKKQQNDFYTYRIFIESTPVAFPIPGSCSLITSIFFRVISNHVAIVIKQSNNTELTFYVKPIASKSTKYLATPYFSKDLSKEEVEQRLIDIQTLYSTSQISTIVYNCYGIAALICKDGEVSLYFGEACENSMKKVSYSFISAKNSWTIESTSPPFCLKYVINKQSYYLNGLEATNFNSTYLHPNITLSYKNNIIATAKCFIDDSGLSFHTIYVRDKPVIAFPCTAMYPFLDIRFFNIETIALTRIDNQIIQLILKKIGFPNKVTLYIDSKKTEDNFYYAYPYRNLSEQTAFNKFAKIIGSLPLFNLLLAGYNKYGIVVFGYENTEMVCYWIDSRSDQVIRMPAYIVKEEEGELIIQVENKSITLSKINNAY